MGLCPDLPFNPNLRVRCPGNDPAGFATSNTSLEWRRTRRPSCSGPRMAKARRLSKRRGKTANLFGETHYAANCWKGCILRVLIKAKVMRLGAREPGVNARFVVQTSKALRGICTKWLYCGRTEIESRTTDLYHGPEIDRTRCTSRPANQWRGAADCSRRRPDAGSAHQRSSRRVRSRPRLKAAGQVAQAWRVDRTFRAVHRARTFTMANRTAQENQIRGLLSELGIVVHLGRTAAPSAARHPRRYGQRCARPAARTALWTAQTAASNRCARYRLSPENTCHGRSHEPALQLMHIEAIAPRSAIVLVATVGDPHVVKNARRFAARLRFTTRHRPNGGKRRLGQFTRQDDGYLRTLLVHGARVYRRDVDAKIDAQCEWTRRLKECRRVVHATVALAAKHARIAWTTPVHGAD